MVLGVKLHCLANGTSPSRVYRLTDGFTSPSSQAPEELPSGLRIPNVSCDGRLAARIAVRSSGK